MREILSTIYPLDALVVQLVFKLCGAGCAEVMSSHAKLGDMEGAETW